MRKKGISGGKMELNRSGGYYWDSIVEAVQILTQEWTLTVSYSAGIK